MSQNSFDQTNTSSGTFSDAPSIKPKYTRATQANPNVQASPINTLEQPRSVKTGGRPKKLAQMPVMPGLTDAEEILFNDFIAEYLELFPDLLATDYRILFLAATAYIKFLRVTANELASGTVLAMSRQHPGVEMRALLDQLSVTRRARSRTKADEPESAEIRDFFMKLSDDNAHRGR